MHDPPHIGVDHLQRREQDGGHELLLQLGITNDSFPCLDSLAVTGLLLARVFVPPQLMIDKLAGIVDISLHNPPLRIAGLQVVHTDKESGSEGGDEKELEDRVVVENKQRLLLVCETDFLKIIPNNRRTREWE